LAILNSLCSAGFDCDGFIKFTRNNMKYWRLFLMILVIVSGLIAAPPVGEITISQPEDRWFAMDKLKHFSTSFYLTTTLFYGQNRIFDVKSDQANLNAAGLTISLGVLKEIRDLKQKENYFSWRDLVVDILGVGAAIFFINGIK